MTATLYYDLASPYAYLAFTRAADVLGATPKLQPVLVGAIFAHRGWGSWSEMDTRDTNVAEIERRATLERIAAQVGLDGVRDGVAQPEVKAALRDATDSAIARGVPGVPTLATADGRLLFGDDRLAEAGAVS